MAGLRDVLARIASGAITIRTVETQIPSPFAASLQFGFVIDHMYGDDAPRAEQRAALLSLDRALLDELMGGEGADDATLAMLDELLARRRGTAPGRQARDADELAVLVDRAGDLTRDELEARVAPPTDRQMRAIRSRALLASGRLLGVAISRRCGGHRSERFILVDAYSGATPRRSAPRRWRPCVAGEGLAPRAAADVVPEVLRDAVLTRARRAPRGRWRVGSRSPGPVSVDDVRARYDFDARVGASGGWRSGSGSGCSCAACSVATAARTRWMLAAAAGAGAPPRAGARRGKQIEAVPLERFARFLQRWQHLAPTTRLDRQRRDGPCARAAVWAGASRRGMGARLPAGAGRGVRRRARSRGSRRAGTLVWAADPRREQRGEPAKVGRVRFFERGTGRLWLGAPVGRVALSDERARGARRAPQRRARRSRATSRLRRGLGPRRRAMRCASWWRRGSSTNDTIDALRDVLRWTPRAPDASGATSRIRHAGCRPTSRRPRTAGRAAAGEPAAAAEVEASGPRGGRHGGWGGRWSLVHIRRDAGPAMDEQQSGRADRATVARSIRHRVARLVASRASGRRMARDLPGAQAARVPRRGAARVLRGGAGRRAVRAAGGGRAAACGAAEAEEAPVVMAASDPGESSIRCRCRRERRWIRSRGRAARGRCS